MLKLIEQGSQPKGSKTSYRVGDVIMYNGGKVFAYVI